MNLSWLDNGAIKVGADLNMGGAIAFLESAERPGNLINSFDYGRQVQMSHYSGPVPFEAGGRKPHPTWTGIGWNPIQVGDCFGNPSRIVDHSNDGTTIHVACVPMHWPLENVPGECVYEWWLTLNGNSVRIRARARNERPDRKQYPARGQELPAVYANAPLYRLVSYLGDRPFTDDAATLLVGEGDGRGWPWSTFAATEGWAALVDADNWGVGVWSPGIMSFSGGFAGGDAWKGKGGAKDFATGYIAPNAQDIFDHNIAYEYTCDLIVGRLSAIREHVYRQERQGVRPCVTFRGSRHHWRLSDAADTGWPILDGLRISSAGPSPELVSPILFWRAEDVPELTIEAAFPSEIREAAISVRPFTEADLRGWDAWGPNVRPAPEWLGPWKFPVSGGGMMRPHRVELVGRPGYAGTMLGMRVHLPGGRCHVRKIG